MYVYIKTESSLWTVGFYKPDGQFEPESDHDTPEAAAEKVTELNGGKTVVVPYKRLPVYVRERMEGLMHRGRSIDFEKAALKLALDWLTEGFDEEDIKRYLIERIQSIVTNAKASTDATN